MPFAFEKLLAYQKAVDFSAAICAESERFERGYGFLVDQLNRAALSIATNIAEGNGRLTKAERRHFFGIARGSPRERQCGLQLSDDIRQYNVSYFSITWRLSAFPTVGKEKWALAARES